jgi:hypothetical protein
VTARFLCEAIDQRSVEETADGGNEEQEVDAEVWELRAADSPCVAVVRVTGREFGHPQDEIAEQHRTGASSGADEERKWDERRIRAPQPVEDAR